MDRSGKAPLDAADLIRTIFEEAVAAHERFATQGPAGITSAAETIVRAVAAGRQLFAFGNGGSAADAQHFAAELVGRFEVERRPLPAVALTSDSSIVTALANDFGYDQVFARQISAHGRAGDVAVGISTSGLSRNVEAGLVAAKAGGLVTIVLTGARGGRLGAHADIHLNVRESSTARVQEVHRTILHAICALVDRMLTGDAKKLASS
jgi:D-sedoheptulose 7-phosphate isomerase